MPDEQSGSVTVPDYRLDGEVAVLTLDDGKANAITHEVLDGLDRSLDKARDEARAVVIAGRPGRFSAGFHLGTMTAGEESMRNLVVPGARLLMRLYGYELPTVVACTGHALAAGALLLLVGDHRVGAEGDFKIGLNEVAIGMALPVFGVELARQRLAVGELGPATFESRIYSPAGAVDAGYLDQVVPAGKVLEAALVEARRLAELRTGAYARTKRAVRQSTIDHILGTLDDDMATISAPDDGAS